MTFGGSGLFEERWGSRLQKSPATNCLLWDLRYHSNVAYVAQKSRQTSRPSPRIFLLSPANATGIRAKLILREGASFPLALRLRDGRSTLGEAFSFISGLYFRGKLAYARAFALPPPHAPGALVITACGGLLSPEMPLTRDALREISSASVSLSDDRYRIPFERDARLLAERIGTSCDVVLLGSIATPKYIEPLLNIFGDRLLFPAGFAGRGDMSRGGLMLRCARSGEQLNYVPVATAQRHGARPPKLSPIGNGRSTWRLR